MKHKLVIGLSGKMGVGKTTIANHIKCILEGKGHESVIFPFGKVLKSVISNVFEFPEEWCNTNKAKRITFNHPNFFLPDEYHKSDISNFTKMTVITPTVDSMTVREILQWWGTDVVRNAIDKDFWAKEWQRRIEKIPCNIIIVDDVRFLNEVSAIHEYVHLLYRIDTYHGWNDFSVHESETALDAYPFPLTHTKHPSYGDGYLRCTANEIVKDMEWLYL